MQTNCRLRSVACSDSNHHERLLAPKDEDARGGERRNTQYGTRDFRHLTAGH